MHKTHTPFRWLFVKSSHFLAILKKMLHKSRRRRFAAVGIFSMWFSRCILRCATQKKKTNTPPRLRWNLTQVAMRAKPCLERLFPPARCSRPELFFSVIARDVSPRRFAELFDDITSVISFWFLLGGLRRSAQVLLALFFNGAIMYSETHFGEDVIRYAFFGGPFFC